MLSNDQINVEEKSCHRKLSITYFKFGVMLVFVELFWLYCHYKRIFLFAKSFLNILFLIMFRSFKCSRRVMDDFGGQTTMTTVNSPCQIVGKWVFRYRKPPLNFPGSRKCYTKAFSFILAVCIFFCRFVSHPIFAPSHGLGWLIVD